MKNFDTNKDILGYDYYETNVCDETKEKVELRITGADLGSILYAWRNDPSIYSALQELARVYELVRQGRVG